MGRAWVVGDNGNAIKNYCRGGRWKKSLEVERGEEVKLAGDGFS